MLLSGENLNSSRFFPKRERKKRKKLHAHHLHIISHPNLRRRKKNCEKKRDSTDTVFLSGVDQSQTSKHVALFSVGLSLNVSSVLISVFPPSFLPFTSRPVLWPLEGVLGTPGTQVACSNRLSPAAALVSLLISTFQFLFFFCCLQGGSRGEAVRRLTGRVEGTQTQQGEKKKKKRTGFN